MDEIMEIGGQALLAALAAITLIGITTFLLFDTDTSVMTLGKYMFLIVDSLLP